MTDDPKRDARTPGDPGANPDTNPDANPDTVKGPGGMTLRQIHEQVRRSAARDREALAAHHAKTQPQSRWQRMVRFVWGRSGRR